MLSRYPKVHVRKIILELFIMVSPAEMQFNLSCILFVFSIYLCSDLPGVVSKENLQSDDTFNVCATHTTMRSCRQLKTYSSIGDIQFGINCILLTEDAFCSDRVHSGAADLGFISGNSLYHALRSSVSMIAYVKQPVEDLIRSVLVVDTRKIHTLGDIKGKRGSFSEYGDASFLGFIIAMKDMIWPNSSPFSRGLNEYMNKSCMPGIQDTVGHEPYPFKLDMEKHCALCGGSYDAPMSFSCNPDNTNAFYGSQGVLDCTRRRADFGVLRLTDNLTLPENKPMKVMCKNGTLAQIDSLDVDHNCLLSVTPAQVIISNKDNPKALQISTMLEKVERLSAVRSHHGNDKKDDVIVIEMVSTTKNEYVRKLLDGYNNIPDYEWNQIKADDIDTSFLWKHLVMIILSCVVVFVIIICVGLKIKKFRNDQRQLYEIVYRRKLKDVSDTKETFKSSLV